MRADSDRYQYLTFCSDADRRRLGLGEPGPLSASWKPVPLKLTDDARKAKRPPSDTPGLLPGLPILNQRAVEALTDVLKRNGEVLPVECDLGPHYLFNVTRIIDALDVERSDLFVFASGRIGDVDQYEFVEDRLTDASIFRLPQFKSRIYVTDRFVDAVERAELVGFDFKLLWTSHDTTT